MLTQPVSPSTETRPTSRTSHDLQAWKSRQKMRPLWQRIWSRISRRGPLQTLRFAWYQLMERLWERRLGIETAQCIPWQQLGNDADREDYMPTDYQLFFRALRRVKIDPARDVFLDYGSGKGRNLVLAARAPFRRVIGVEFVERLCEQAQQNLIRCDQQLQCRTVEICQADATTWPCPDDVTVIFLFNPFTGPILAGALDQIAQSLQRAPRPLTIFYLQPVRDENQLARTPWLKEQAKITTSPRDDVRMFEYHAGL